MSVASQYTKLCVADAARVKIAFTWFTVSVDLILYLILMLTGIMIFKELLMV